MNVWVALNYPHQLLAYSTELPTDGEQQSEMRQFCLSKVSPKEDPYVLSVRAARLPYTTLPRCLQASDKLITEFKVSNKFTFDSFWRSLRKTRPGVLTFSDLEKVAADWEIDVPHVSLKILFQDRSQPDQKDGRYVLSKNKFRELLESLVYTPEESKSGSRSRRGTSMSARAMSTPRSVTMTSSYQNGDLQKDTIGEGNEDEASDHDDSDDEDAEEVELPDFTETWTKESKEIAIKCWAVFLLLLGTVIVSFFSDPMVDVLNNFGHTIGVNPFYVSFIVTPLASNASEVICGLKAAARKSNKSMSVCACALYGAATMNCTFCLCIFLGLVYFRELSWDYTAEVAAVLMTIWVVGILGLKDTFTMVDAVIIAALFPISVVMIWFMENILGIK